MTTAFPLTWPATWPRIKAPQAARFNTTLVKALTNVETALARFSKDSGKPVASVVISTNYTLTDRKPRDAGVAVYFTWDGLPSCYAVDRYILIEDNLQAIYHCIEAERTKLRHGGLNVVRAAFRGYAALPPPNFVDDPWTVLQIKPTKSVEAIRQAYRSLAETLHPDRGGSTDAMARLNTARDLAMQEARS